MVDWTEKKVSFDIFVLKIRIAISSYTSFFSPHRQKRVAKEVDKDDAPWQLTLLLHDFSLSRIIWHNEKYDFC